MQRELSDALGELETFREHRERQNVLLEEISQQRDSYKRLLNDVTQSNTVDEMRGEGGEGMWVEGRGGYPGVERCATASDRDASEGRAHGEGLGIVP